MALVKRNRTVLFVLGPLLAVALVLLLVVGGLAGPAQSPQATVAPVPGVISYQGVLEDPSTGQPKPDGSYSMAFRIFEAATGGTALWSETQTVPLAAPVSAQTQVGGFIDTNATWTAAGSPFIVTSSVLIMAGFTLTIEPGVVVKFNSAKGLQVDGQLIARGTKESPITFTSNQASPAPNDWVNILFTNSSVDAVFDEAGNYLSGSIMQYSTVEYGGGGRVPAVKTVNSSPFIDSSHIRYNGGELSAEMGGGISVNGDSPRITNNTITNNRAGVAGGGIDARYGTVTISGNTITHNSSGHSGGGIFVYGAAATISGNTITHNSAGMGNGGGIFANESTGTISGNTITNNSANGGGGIFARKGPWTISGNTITHNSAGLGGGIWASSAILTISISGNTITNNSSAVTGGGIHAEGGAVTINNNNLYSNAPYDVAYGSPQGSIVDVTNNWWGTTDQAAIQAHIWDWNDNATLGIVDYVPFLTEPDLTAPPSSPVGLAAIGDANALTIELSWNANPEADIAGYKVYYDTDAPGFPYSGTGAAEGASPINVGNVTSFTLSGLGSTYYIAITAYDGDGEESRYSEEAEVTLAPGLDTTPPYTSGHSPAQGAVGVPVDTNIVVHIRDDGAGVDISSITLTIDSVEVTSDAVITGNPADYTVSYDPPVDFAYGQVVDVIVDASDLASPPNVMSTDSYSFTTAESGAIQGHIYLQGRPSNAHAGATVSANGYEVTTDTAGNFTIPDLPAGTYTVTVSLPGFLGVQRPGVPVVADKTTLLPPLILLWGDANGDGVINILDLALLGINFGNTSSPWPGQPTIQ